MQIDLSNQEYDQETLEQQFLIQLDRAKERITHVNISGNRLESIRFLHTFAATGQLSHVKILNISKNFIQEVSVINLQQLMTIDASVNPVKSITIQKCPNLKSVDMRECNLTDILFMNLLEQPFKPRHLRLANNNISNTSVEIVSKNPMLADLIGTQLMSLDLKYNPSEYQTIQQIRSLLPEDQQQSQQAKLLTAPMLNQSRTASSKSTVTTHAETRDLIKLMKSLQSEKKLTWPQALASTMLGSRHPIVEQVKQLDHGRSKNHICSALLIGIKSNPDLEEQICQGFARRVGSIYCQDYKLANQISCQERCELVLNIAQKKIDAIQQKK